MSSSDCPFCRVSAERIFFAGDQVLGLWDAYPVTPGHALLVTRRHIETWFDATAEEQQELTSAIAAARTEIRRRYSVDGFNIGINVGAAGGQTVPHLHVHVIPRTTGDVSDPRGGVRNVIPERANYLGNASVVTDVAAPQPTWATSPNKISGHRDSASPRLIAGQQDDPLLPHILDQFDRANRVDLAVAFILRSGFERIRGQLHDLLERGGHARILTGDYLDVTDPFALRALLDLSKEFHELGDESPYPEDRLEVRVFGTKNRSFHPKAYLFQDAENTGVGFVGSSNLSKTALEDGVEWNYRVVTSHDHEGFDSLAEGFERLFQHPDTEPLTDEWIEAYEERRRPSEEPRLVDASPEPAPEVPDPHPIQQEALTALADTRASGNRAGLVVLATGLGKTWLSAFDSGLLDDDGKPLFPRVLFVAHRKEILAQAMNSFRGIRPNARLGMFTGKEKTDSAEVVFASVQTLGRKRRLETFDPADFDYIVVDEFHHAAAQTYRRILDYFEPKFLLGLTATPERTDGGDLLGLCGENLVYRCDLNRGIELGLLSPFHYFGVPDVVDYTNVPWRSTRFDPEALENAVTTEARAENALEQWREHAGPGARTLAFCCSKKHANYMARFFEQAGVRVAAVHSGVDSAPRASSLAKLAGGKLDVVFAVDMFNEGVDIPNIDTILMLRPTESRILWLQQFGRGLRCADDKERLTVVDYIGNHKVFLNKPMALLGTGSNHREIQEALNSAHEGKFELPPGCEVTYDLEAIDILRGLLRIPKGEAASALRDWYVEFRERTGERPTASQAFREGYNPRAARKRYGSWLGLVRTENGFASEAAALLDTSAGEYLEHLETTPMAKSFKMLVLLAMLNADEFPGKMKIDKLAAGFARLAHRHTNLTDEVEVDLEDTAALHAYLEKNPIQAWTGGKGTGGTAYFDYTQNVFRTTFSVPGKLRPVFQELARELADWRLTEYQARDLAPSGSTFRCRVSHASGRPILFLPDRSQIPGIPTGTLAIEINGEPHEVDVVKIAINVARKAGDKKNKNVLPAILHGWFGPDAGLPGTQFSVEITPQGDSALQMKPVGPTASSEELELWKRYTRAQIPSVLDFEIAPNVLNTGVVTKDQYVLLFVTLENTNMPEQHQYKDAFLSPTLLQWQSQNATRQDSNRGKIFRDAEAHGKTIHLFVRPRGKENGATVPFVYCGSPEFIDWEGEKPITIRWQLKDAVPEYLREKLSVPEEAPQ